MNRANLEKLAAYLEQLPEDYSHFGMMNYMAVKQFTYPYTSSAHLIDACGAVACAIGHGPAAGIPRKGDYEYWSTYSHRVFDLGYDDFDWCFCAEWLLVDDTPHGAAKRIRYLLEHGEPDDAVAQMQGRAPYLFAKEEEA
jgi:hypothetical protein